MPPRRGPGQEKRLFFGADHPPLSAYSAVPWDLELTRSVEFFPGEFTRVSLTSTRNPDLRGVLLPLYKEPTIVLALKGAPSLYQLCYSPASVVLIRDLEPAASPILSAFLTQKQFVGKGTGGDAARLARRYGAGFSAQVEDIEATALEPRHLPVEFSEMVSFFVGAPTAPFWSPDAAASDWEAEPLALPQVLHAAFDVLAVFLACAKLASGAQFHPRDCEFHLLQNAVFLEETKAPPDFPPIPFSFCAALANHMAARFPQVRPDFCGLCGEGVEGVEDHVWQRHSDEMFSLFNWRLDLPLAVADIRVTSSGRLAFAPCARSNGYASFAAYYAAWRAAHPWKPQAPGQRVQCKEVFYRYLEKTGRVTPGRCHLCRRHVGPRSLAAHCWNDHSGLLIEWLPAGSIALHRMNDAPKAVGHAWHFLYRLKLLKLIGHVCECTACGARFLGPVSLVCHAIVKHCRVSVAGSDVVRAHACSDLARDLIECSPLFPNEWETGIDQVASLITLMDENRPHCDDCNRGFENILQLRAHILRKHIVIERSETESPAPLPLPSWSPLVPEPSPPSPPVPQPSPPPVPHLPPPPPPKEDWTQGRNLYVRGFDASMTDVKLQQIFSEYGSVRNAKVQRNPDTHESKLFGFVCFDEVSDAQRCIKESVLLRFNGSQAYVTEKASPAQRKRDGNSPLPPDPLERLRTKIASIRPVSLHATLIRNVKRMSEQQAVMLIEDNALFGRWAALR
jgi:hypothetical protein